VLTDPAADAAIDTACRVLQLLTIRKPKFTVAFDTVFTLSGLKMRKLASREQ
jgi:hypothetical protein